jgi:hypothetical protein
MALQRVCLVAGQVSKLRAGDLLTKRIFSGVGEFGLSRAASAVAICVMASALRIPRRGNDVISDLGDGLVEHGHLGRVVAGHTTERN